MLDLLKLRATLHALMGEKQQAWENYQSIEGILFPGLQGDRAAADKKRAQAVKELSNMTVELDPAFLLSLAKK